MVEKRFIVKSHVHCSVNSELLKDIYELGLTASDVLEFGCKFKLSEFRDNYPVPDNYLSKKILVLQGKIRELGDKNEELQEELSKWQSKVQEENGKLP